MLESRCKHSRSRKNCFFMEARPSLAPHRASFDSQDSIILRRVGFVFLRSKGAGRIKNSSKSSNASGRIMPRATRTGQQSFENGANSFSQASRVCFTNQDN